MRLFRMLAVLLTFIIAAAGFAGCDSAETEEAAEVGGEFTRLTQESMDLLFENFNEDMVLTRLTQEAKDLLFEHFEEDIALTFLSYSEEFEEMGLAIYFDVRIRRSRTSWEVTYTEFVEKDVVIDILPDVPFGLTDESALETFFNFRVFLLRYANIHMPFLSIGGVSEALENEIRAREGLAELYFRVGNRVHVESFFPGLIWTLNEYSNFNQETFNFLKYRFIGPPPWGMTLTAPEILTFMRF